MSDKQGLCLCVVAVTIQRVGSTMWTLPSLSKLSLTAPTGGLGDDDKQPMKAARAESEEAPQFPLVELPIEVRELFTHELIATLGGDLTSLCTTLRRWCTAHPDACSHDSVWREAFALVFGLPVKRGTPVPLRLHNAILGTVADTPEEFTWLNVNMTWQHVFSGLCEDFERLSEPGKEMWAGVAQWTPREVDEMTARVTSPTNTEFNQMSGKRVTIADESFGSPLMELLIARGGDAARYYTGARLSRDLIHAANWHDLNDMRRLLAAGAWPDFIDPSRVPRPHGWGSALLASITSYDTFDLREAVHMLLEAGVGKALDYGEAIDADDPESFEYQNGDVGSPLYFAVRGQHAAIVEELLDYGATAYQDHLSLAVFDDEGLGSVITRLLVEKGRVRPTAETIENAEAQAAALPQGQVRTSIEETIEILKAALIGD